MGKNPGSETDEVLAELRKMAEVRAIAELGKAKGAKGVQVGSKSKEGSLFRQTVSFAAELPMGSEITQAVSSDPGVTSLGLGARVATEFLPGSKYGKPTEVAKGFPLELSFAPSPEGAAVPIVASIRLTGSLLAQNSDGKAYLSFNEESSELLVRSAVVDAIDATEIRASSVGAQRLVADFAKCDRLALGASAPIYASEFPNFASSLSLAVIGDAVWYGQNTKSYNQPRMLFTSETGTLSLGRSSGVPTIELSGDAGDIRLLGGDCAEEFDSDLVLPPGTVVVGTEKAGAVAASSEDCDRRVVGVVSGANGLAPGIVLHSLGGSGSIRVPVALAGKVWCKADANDGPIGIGDLLVSSKVEGHARAIHGEPPAGTVIGKALSRLEGGVGFVLALVLMR